MSTCSQKWKIYIYHVLRHVFYIIRSRLNEFLPRSHDDTGCARIVFRGWPSSWSESKQSGKLFTFLQFAFSKLQTTSDQHISTTRYDVTPTMRYDVPCLNCCTSFSTSISSTANREGPAYLVERVDTRSGFQINTAEWFNGVFLCIKLTHDFKNKIRPWTYGQILA